MEQKPTHFPDSVSISSYNRQHPMATDPESGKRYDPLERDFDKYQALFLKPQTVSMATVAALPLSVGIMRSYLEFTAGERNGAYRFPELARKYGDGNFITDVGDYATALREMREIQALYADAKKPPVGPGGGSIGGAVSRATTRVLGQ